jgi:hypothetical protein
MAQADIQAANEETEAAAISETISNPIPKKRGRKPKPKSGNDAVAAPAVHSAKSLGSSDTCTVALKLPNGLTLRGFKPTTINELVMGGGSREVTVYVPTGEEYSLHGTAVPWGQVPTYPIVCGFALTSNIPREFMERWLSANKSSALVKNGLIFINPDMASTEDQAKDHADLRSGLGPIIPPEVGADPRIPSKITTAAENKTVAGNSQVM